MPVPLHSAVLVSIPVFLSIPLSIPLHSSVVSLHSSVLLLSMRSGPRASFPCAPCLMPPCSSQTMDDKYRTNPRLLAALVGVTSYPVALPAMPST